MSERMCGHLDDYLGGWLDATASAAFEAHLAQCAACRGECERQHQLEALLVQARTELELVPPALVQRLGRRYAALRRRRRIERGVGLAAAAVLLFSVLTWTYRGGADHRQALVSVPPDPVRPHPVPPPPPAEENRASLGQLALWVTARCAGTCPSDVTIARLPRIPQPTGPVLPALRVLPAHPSEEAQETPEPEKDGPKYAAAPVAPGGSYIQTRFTRGARGLTGIVTQ